MSDELDRILEEVRRQGLANVQALLDLGLAPPESRAELEARLRAYHTETPDPKTPKA